MNIYTASPDDAPLIAEAILEAIGDELTDNLAGESHSREDVKALFTRLAEREDTQYSYRNTRIAEDEAGRPMGVCVSYNGADNFALRVPFFEEAVKTLGWDIDLDRLDEIPGETSEGEFYLDTLMTLPEYRGRGVAKALIEDAYLKAKNEGLPLALLCDTGNQPARRLYDAVGFREAGTRPFAGHLMNRLVLD